MPKVSVAMIARNAQDTIDAALKSIYGYVDEIVIVDTGSTDETLYRARIYADMVYERAWPDSFAAARQTAFDLTTGDWIMHLDADDIVEGADQIRTVLSNVPDWCDCIYWQYVTAVDQHGNVTNLNWRERCVKRGTHFWKGRAHEVLVSPNGSKLIRESSVVIHHQQIERDHRAHIERNIRLLRLQLAEEPVEDSRVLFYLGRDLQSIGQLDEAQHFLERYLAVATWDQEKYFALLLLGYIHRMHKEYDRAMETDLQAGKLLPMWPLAWFAAAEDAYFEEDWQQVIMLSRIGQALPAPETQLFAGPRALEYDWMIFYAVALAKTGQTAEALEVTRRALAVVPDDPYHLQNLRTLEGLTNGAGGVIAARSSAPLTPS